jgi:crossover junction endodeoxyribonuclease RuvC
MYILGIDPGFAIVGWGIVEASRGKVRPVAYGAITTPAHAPIESRLLMIQNDLEAIIDKYHPEEMAVEELFFNTNITTGIAVAEARGVIICTAHKHGVKVSEYTPLQVKQAVVGYGKAEKQQVIAMVTALLKLPKPPKPDDTADALAIAICHSQCAGSAIGKYFNQRG